MPGGRGIGQGEGREVCLRLSGVCPASYTARKRSACAAEETLKPDLQPFRPLPAGEQMGLKVLTSAVLSGLSAAQAQP